MFISNPTLSKKTQFCMKCKSFCSHSSIHFVRTSSIFGLFLALRWQVRTWILRLPSSFINSATLLFLICKPLKLFVRCVLDKDWEIFINKVHEMCFVLLVQLTWSSIWYAIRLFEGRYLLLWILSTVLFYFLAVSGWTLASLATSTGFISFFLDEKERSQSILVYTSVVNWESLLIGGGFLPISILELFSFDSCFFMLTLLM